jgi:hypothetical protein
VAPDTRATSFVFRALLAVASVTAAYGIISVVVAVIRARSGDANLDEVAGTMGLAMMCVVAAVVFVVFAFLARMFMRRIARSDA